MSELLKCAQLRHVTALEGASAATGQEHVTALSGASAATEHEHSLRLSRVLKAILPM